MTTTGAKTTEAELDEILDRVGREPATGSVIGDVQLVGLQSRWARALSARLDQAIALAGPGEPLAGAVAAAWRALAAAQTTLRGVLDAAELRSPALAAAMSVEFRYLALAAGLVGADDSPEEAIRLGQQFRDRIRSEVSRSRVGAVG